MKNMPLTEDELVFIDEVLMRYGNDDSVLDASELDGFLTALVSMPPMIPPSEWFPLLWGGDGYEPEWESQAELERFVALVFQHMNDVISRLMLPRGSFVALLNEADEEDEDEAEAETEIVEVSAAEWSYGYLRALSLAESLPDLPEEQEENLDAILFHTLDEGMDMLDGMTPEERREAALAVEIAAQDLYSYWHDQRGAIEGRLPVVKAGRNDPCPCGSGKKYKHCCLH